MGIVGCSGRARKVVAPNSPRDIVNANNAADMIARNKIGNSTCQNVLQGDAPNTIAEYFNSRGMEAITGCNILTTKGMATNEWAMGTSKGNDRTSRGGRLKTSMNPKPKVTAEVPNGSIRMGSRSLPQRERDEITLAAKKPKNKAIPTVTRPKYNELKIASIGGT